MIETGSIGIKTASQSLKFKNRFIRGFLCYQINNAAKDIAIAGIAYSFDNLDLLDVVQGDCRPVDKVTTSSTRRVHCPAIYGKRNAA